MDKYCIPLVRALPKFNCPFAEISCTGDKRKPQRKLFGDERRKAYNLYDTL